MSIYLLVFIGIFEYKFPIFSIDDILEDSDSDLNDSDEEMDDKKTKGPKKNQKIFINEAPEEIVDFTDIKSIGNVLSECFHLFLNIYLIL